MDLTILMNYIDLMTLGICICVGYALKTAFNQFPNKFIPLVMLCLGTICNLIINRDQLNAGIILGGMISGLASTGMYEMFRNLLGSQGQAKKDG